jgi:hypothetical protein
VSVKSAFEEVMENFAELMQRLLEIKVAKDTEARS